MSTLVEKLSPGEDGELESDHDSTKEENRDSSKETDDAKTDRKRKHSDGDDGLNSGDFFGQFAPFVIHRLRYLLLFIDHDTFCKLTF